MSTSPHRPVLLSGLRWLLVGGVLLPAVATMAVGIVILSVWQVAADIALGVLTTCFAVFTLAGTATTWFALERRQRLVRAREQLVAQVSHELRTPLSSIRMYVETLRLGRVRDDAEREEFLAEIDKETARLGELVERLLDFRDVQHRGLKARREPTDPAEVAREAVDEVHADDRPRLELVVEPALPVVAVEPKAAREALGNLIRNALLHGDAAAPVVVTVRADGAGVAFHVRDQGPGIARSEQRRIFESFERGEAAQQQQTPGLGVGLALVRQFAEAHGGRASVDSALGRGSTFTIWLPIIDDDAAPPSSRDSASQAGAP